MRSAFATAITFNTYSHRFVRGLLEASTGATLSSTCTDPTPSDPLHLPVVFAHVPPTPVQRDLAVYQGILEGVGQ